MTGKRLRDMTPADWYAADRNAFERDEAAYQAEQDRAPDHDDDPLVGVEDDPWGGEAA